MVEERLARFHRVLVVAEERQARRAMKCASASSASARVTGQPKASRSPKWSEKRSRDQRHDLARDRVRRKARARWRRLTPAGSALRFSGRNSTGRRPARRPPSAGRSRAASRGRRTPCGRILRSAAQRAKRPREQKKRSSSRISTGTPQASRTSSRIISQHAPFAGLGHDDAVRRMPRHGARELAGEGAGVARVVQPDIVDPQPLAPPAPAAKWRMADRIRAIFCLWWRT